MHVSHRRFSVRYTVGVYGAAYRERERKTEEEGGGAGVIITCTVIFRPYPERFPRTQPL